MNNLDIRIDPKLGKDIVISIDSTGVKAADRGKRMRQKRHMRRGFLKIHVGADVKPKKIVSLKITDDCSHDGIQERNPC